MKKFILILFILIYFSGIIRIQNIDWKITGDKITILKRLKAN